MRIPVFFLLFLASILSAADRHETITRQFVVEDGGLLELQTALGVIDVEGVEGNRVVIEVGMDYRTSERDRIEQTREKMLFDFVQDGNTVQAGLEYESPGSWFGGRKTPHVSWTVKVPRRFSVDLNTRGGSIAVSNLEGSVQATTHGGHIEVSGVNGTVHVRTSGGHISCEGVLGNMDLRTSGGHIAVNRSEGETLARTSGGHIEIDRARGLVDARSSGGRIEVRLLGPLLGDCSLRTSGGGIELFIDDAVEANLYAHTSGGRVFTNVPILLEGAFRQNRIVGQIGEGGPSLDVRTSGGSIEILKAE